MSVYEQGEGEMESANNVNFLGPICHLSGSRSGGSFIIPTPAPPSPPSPRSTGDIPFLHVPTLFVLFVFRLID